MNPLQPSAWKIPASLTCLVLMMFAGSASAQLTVTYANQKGASPFTPTWVVNTNISLIAGLVPIATLRAPLIP